MTNVAVPPYLVACQQTQRAALSALTGFGKKGKQSKYEGKESGGCSLSLSFPLLPIHSLFKSREHRRSRTVKNAGVDSRAPPPNLPRKASILEGLAPAHISLESIPLNLSFAWGRKLWFVGGEGND